MYYHATASPSLIKCFSPSNLTCKLKNSAWTLLFSTCGMLEETVFSEIVAFLHNLINMQFSTCFENVSIFLNDMYLSVAFLVNLAGVNVFSIFAD